MPTLQPPSAEPLPSWYMPLSLRAHDEALPDLAIKACLEYVDKLRRERDRLLTDLTTARAAAAQPSLPLLDRLDAALGYLTGLENAGAEHAPIAEVLRRLEGSSE